MADYLDLTVEGKTTMKLTKGIAYPALTWTIESPPAAFTITMDTWDAGSPQVWTVGSGITISGDDVIWNIGTVANDAGRYYGSIITDDITYGVAFKSDIEIIVEE